VKYILFIIITISFDVVGQIDVQELQRHHNELMDTVEAIQTDFASIAKFPGEPDRSSVSGTLKCTEKTFLRELDKGIESWTNKHRFMYSKDSATLEVLDNPFGPDDYYWPSFHITNLNEADKLIRQDEYYTIVFFDVEDDYIEGTRVYWMNAKTYKIDAFEIYTGYYGIGEVLILSNLTLNPALEPYFSEFPDKIILSTYPNAVIKDSTYDNPYTRP
jgi:hypothetical protein